jgi:hypothetical protein
MEAKLSQATAIENRISAAEPGTVFIASDFSDLGSRDNVNQVLCRLVRRGDIIRAVRGVYGKPKWSRYFKVWIQPSPNKVAHGIARMNGWVISPSADYALNKLGLDNQVPAHYEYASTGPSRVYRYGQFDIHMHHHATRDLIGCSPITMLVNLALRALGRDEAGGELAERLAGQLSREDIEAYFEETRNNSSWIHEFARSMKEKKGC